MELPFSLAQDSKSLAISNALNRAISLFSQNKSKVLLLPNLDNLPDAALDHLAYQWHVDNYDINLNPAVKRFLIRDSLNFHKLKGTPYAVKSVLNLFFDNPILSEWFDYGGKPYFFKIAATSMKDIGDGDFSFWRMLDDAKNVRSWLESIDLNLPTDDFPHYHAIAEPIGGNSQTNLDLPPDSEHLLFHANTELLAGISTVSYQFDPPPDSEHLLFHANTELLAGEISDKFAFSDDKNCFFYASTELFSGIEITAADLSYDFEPNSINLFFQFPSGVRNISMPNPIDPPNKLEIKRLSIFTAANNLLFNKKGESTDGISHAFLVHKFTFSVL